MVHETGEKVRGGVVGLSFEILSSIPMGYSSVHGGSVEHVLATESVGLHGPSGQVHGMGASPSQWSAGLLQNLAVVDGRTSPKDGETSPCPLLSQIDGGRESLG